MEGARYAMDFPTPVISIAIEPKTKADLDKLGGALQKLAYERIRSQTGLPAQAQGAYQLVLANILAVPLKVLAPLLCAHVAPGGSLVLAGILERQADELTSAYSPHARLEVTDAQDGWVLMTARL